MLLVLSPAKTLDLSPVDPDLPASAPQAHKDVVALAAVTRRLKAADLKRLMDISDKLAALNLQRFKAFDATAQDAGLQAALMFAGDVYDGLEARGLDAAALAWAQDRLRILSGLYGLLRPLDRIQPYRLEMGVRLATRRGQTLYDFWGDRIAKALNAAASSHDDPTVVNLASQEYFHAVDRMALKRPVIACVFRQERDGRSRNLALYSKTARGLMARYAIDHRLDRADDLKGFDRAGYRYAQQASDAQTYVFTRIQPKPKA